MLTVGQGLERDRQGAYNAHTHHAHGKTLLDATDRLPPSTGHVEHVGDVAVLVPGLRVWMMHMCLRNIYVEEILLFLFMPKVTRFNSLLIFLGASALDWSPRTCRRWSRAGTWYL